MPTMYAGYNSELVISFRIVVAHVFFLPKQERSSYEVGKLHASDNLSFSLIEKARLANINLDVS